MPVQVREEADQIGLSSVVDLDEVFGWPCSCGQSVAGLLAHDTEIHECPTCGVTIVAEDLEGELEGSFEDEF